MIRLARDDEAGSALRRLPPEFRWGQQAEQVAAMSLSDQIASEIGARIVTGRYAPGERLLEQQISTEFQVSRNPVREALRILERDGFVDILPRRGAQVASPDGQEVADLFEVVEKLFELIGRNLALRQSAGGIKTLSWSIDLLTEYLDTGAPAENHLLLVNSLSMRLSEFTGNRTLAQLVCRLMTRCIGPIRASFHAAERRQQSIDNWRGLLKAVEKGDVEAAEAAARRLVRDTSAAAKKNAVLAASG